MEIEVMKALAGGLMVFGMMGAAIGVGLIFAALLNGIARNPSASKEMKVMAFVGAGMTELMGLVAIVLAFMTLAG